MHVNWKIAQNVNKLLMDTQNVNQKKKTKFFKIFLIKNKEFGKVVKVSKVLPEIKCKVFEDNTSCIEVATAPSITSRTEHIVFKYHFFKSHVK